MNSKDIINKVGMLKESGSRGGRQPYTGYYSPGATAAREARPGQMKSLKKFRDANPSMKYRDLSDSQRQQVDMLHGGGGQGGNAKQFWNRGGTAQEDIKSVRVQNPNNPGDPDDVTYVTPRQQAVQDRANTEFAAEGTDQRREWDRKRLVDQTSAQSEADINDPNWRAQRTIAQDKISEMDMQDKALDDPSMFGKHDDGTARTGREQQEYLAERSEEGRALREQNPGMSGLASMDAVDQNRARDQAQQEFYTKNPWTDPANSQMLGGIGNYSNDRQATLTNAAIEGRMTGDTLKTFEGQGDGRSGHAPLDYQKRKDMYNQHQQMLNHHADLKGRGEPNRFDELNQMKPWQSGQNAYAFNAANRDNPFMPATSDAAAAAEVGAPPPVPGATPAPAPTGATPGAPAVAGTPTPTPTGTTTTTPSPTVTTPTGTNVTGQSPSVTPSGTTTPVPTPGAPAPGAPVPGATPVAGGATPAPAPTGATPGAPAPGAPAPGATPAPVPGAPAPGGESTAFPGAPDPFPGQPPGENPAPFPGPTPAKPEVATPPTTPTVGGPKPGPSVAMTNKGTGMFGGAGGLTTKGLINKVDGLANLGGPNLDMFKGSVPIGGFSGSVPGTNLGAYS